MSTHADGHFQTLRIPLGGKGLKREEDQNDGAVASMQKVGSESHMKDQPQPRPTPKSNRQWEKTLSPKSSSPLDSHDFQSSTIFTLCVIINKRKREGGKVHKCAVLSSSAGNSASTSSVILTFSGHRMVPD